MYLGIEIGGTKLQLGVGGGDGSPPAALVRLAVDPRRAAEGILEQVAAAGRDLLGEHAIAAIGCGFGGPVDGARGRIVRSHHVDGWDDFPLRQWLAETFARPAVVANDADTAGLAEATFGAGRGHNPVLYVTVGTGIGGGLIVDGRIYRGSGAGAAEIGHLRPGLHADQPDLILEAIAAGWGIAAAAQARVSGGSVSHRIGRLLAGHRPVGRDAVRQRLAELDEAAQGDAVDLLRRCGGRVEELSARVVVEAAGQGNGIAQEVLGNATEALGWGIAQAVTLLAPSAVVIGGGVSLAGEQWFFSPLRRHVGRYVFPPLAEALRILPAALGEEVVVHGALSLARDAIS